MLNKVLIVFLLMGVSLNLLATDDSKELEIALKKYIKAHDYDSSKLVLESMGDTKLMDQNLFFDFLILQGEGLFYKNLMDSSMNIFRQAVRVANNSNITENEFKGYFQLSGMFYMLKQMDSSLIYADLSKSKAVLLPDSKRFVACAMSLSGKCHALNEMGKIQESIATCYEIIKYSDSCATEKQRAVYAGNAYLALANCYNAINDTVNERKSTLKMIENFNIQGDPASIATGHTRLGHLESDLDKKIVLYKKAKELLKGDPETIAMYYQSMLNISNAYMNKKMLDSSFFYLKPVTELLNENKDEYNAKVFPQLYYKTVVLEAGLYDTQKNYPKAIVKYEQSIVLMDMLNQVSDKKKVYLKLSQLYEDQKNFAKAFKYQTLYVELKDSLLTKEKSKQILEVEAKYQTTKKDKEISDLASAKEIAQLQVGQRNYVLAGLTGFLGLLALVGFLVFRQNKIKRDQETTQLEQKLLRTQMNPHFMSNALMSIQTYMYENNTQEAAKYLGKFGKLTRQILDASRQDYITLEEEVQFINNYLDFQQLMFPEKLNYTVSVDQSVEDEEEIMIPPMLSQPFIENAIEHGIRHLKEAKGTIQVAFKQVNDELVLEIQDDGVGRKAAHSINDKVRKNHTSHSTNITTERLKLLKRKYNKHITFKISDLEQGTLVRFNMPLIYG